MMGDDDLWRVKPVKRDDFANGGLVQPGTTIAVFGCDYIVPKRLAKIIGNPFRDNSDGA